MIDGEEAWRLYREWQDKWEAAGIPWNKKGSPHGLRLKALAYLRKTPMQVMVRQTMRYYVPKLVENITRDNPLLKRLMR